MFQQNLHILHIFVVFCLNFVNRFVYQVYGGSTYYLWFAAEMWFLFLPYGSVLLVFVVLFWMPIMGWYRSNYKMFLDKYCIHQSDPIRRNSGVKRIAVYLKSAKTLECVFDDHYMTRYQKTHKLQQIFMYTNRVEFYLEFHAVFKMYFFKKSKPPGIPSRIPRGLDFDFFLKNCMFLNVFVRLWCVWEIAVYLKTRPNPNVIFTSISQKAVEVVGICISLLATMLLSILVWVRSHEGGEGTWLRWYNLAHFGVLDTFIFLIGQQHFTNLFALRDSVTNYDVTTKQTKNKFKLRKFNRKTK